jgi:SAM-dependent methyltransferase
MTQQYVSDPTAYGRHWASDYDELFEDRDDPQAVIALLSRVAADGPVLELGVGTGRLAVPIASSGRAVTGVDASPEMLQLLRKRPGAAGVRAVQGDMATVSVDDEFAAVVIAFSTLFLLPSQELQIRCLVNAARHLRSDGVLILEAFVPDHSRWTRGQNVSVGRLDATSLDLHVGVHDAVEQVIRTQHLQFGDGTYGLRPNTLRYAWPAELDAMALVAGLQRAHRWADWTGSPFGAASTAHVSVYRAVSAAGS